MDGQKTTPHNSAYKKLAVLWLNESQFFNQTFVQVDSFVLRNPPERKARTVILFKKNKDLFTCKLKKFTKIKSMFDDLCKNNYFWTNKSYKKYGYTPKIDIYNYFW
jgi:hypothetical protein